MEKIIDFVQKAAAVISWLALALIIYSLGRYIHIITYRIGMYAFALVVAAVMIYAIREEKDKGNGNSKRKS